MTCFFLSARFHQYLPRVSHKRMQNLSRSEETVMSHGRGTKATANQFTVKCTVHGHHVYKRIWTPQLGEWLETVCKVDNEHDKYAVAVHLCNSATTIPREITCTCHFFINSKGEIIGEMSGRRRRCTAPCGGLEVPCLLTFYHRW